MGVDEGIRPAPEEVRRELEAILASEWLRKSANLQNFLRFVVERTLEGKEDEIKEIVLGREVFHRSGDYDPKSDAIVRVQARLLRGKLDQYYRESPAGTVRIELPKGGYVPVFVAVRKVDAENPQTATPLPEIRASGGWNWRLVLLAGVLPALLLAGLGAFAWQRLGLERRTVAAPLPCPLLWRPFFDGTAPTTIVLGTPNFYQSPNGLLIRDININSADQAANERRLQRISPGAAEAAGGLRPAHYYTGVGEAIGAQRLARFFWRRSRRTAIARGDSPELVALDQEPAGGNLIVVSSLRIRTLVNRLHLPSDFVRVGHQRNIIVNLHPRPGELAQYADSHHNGAYTEYGLLSVWPAPGGRRILLLGGEDTYGTQATVEFATDAARLGDLQHRLTALGASGSGPLAFQALLRITVGSDWSIQGVRCVAVHLLPAGARATTNAQGGTRSIAKVETQSPHGGLIP